ncbi:hypothetical protein BJF92_12255 [Rhizobium rhizosphaerae]|uniref:Peptidoglycan binding-like domain-containing protein n=1 Tax=Xaviernesmea rhizosphaerae TaxID=1672749 RepID=A0A1Q9AN34_9HYPH|nr:M15 family metallopeptidase [Xaviernesmea rhizosphaerae]OLP56837.1 hypothetical protein BJF92_12255 [Xaviernesmea rhizosphaerae]
MTFEQWLQSRLTAHGYAVGPIDGKIGTATIAALKAFEGANGLKVDGIADPAVVAALKASASAVPPKTMTQIPDRDRVPTIDVRQPSAIQWPRQADCMEFYGPVGTRQTTIDIPFDMRLAWARSTVVRKMTLHEKVAPSALIALQRIAEVYSAKERADLGIDIFGGSLNVRRMRGGKAYSMHSWGIAIDFDPERNGLTTAKPQARLSHPDAVSFWLAWETQGWLSLGRARDFDWMHVQAARL